MFTSKTARIVGFLGTLGGAAALVGTAATGTGAYFTDSKAGSLSATSGHMKISTSGISSVDYAHLNPGEDTTKTISYHAQAGNTTKTDIWLYFPDGVAYEAFTGASGNHFFQPGGLGRYGHFRVDAPAGGFDSYNLANDPSTGDSGCADANGHGHNNPPSNASDTQNGYCGIPHFILIQQNLAPGQDGSFQMTFGLGKIAKGQDTTYTAPGGVPFKVVATQPGIRPDNSFNGSLD